MSNSPSSTTMTTTTPSTKRAALYARVSTNDQSTDLQLDGLRDLAARRGWQIQAEYIDQGISGSKDHRPQLDQLMKAVHQGKLDIVVCWRFDRFARSVRHLVNALDTFRAVGVDFVSMEYSIDTSTPAGRFTFHVIAAVAELERELIRERTKAGVAAARRRGARLGRPRAVVDVNQARALRQQGASFRSIAQKLGVGLGTIHTLLRVQDDVRESSSEPASKDGEITRAA
jgi:DNA invertase Pin-like site-specific DNA recombinase